jgi:hypothetical protein
MIVEGAGRFQIAPGIHTWVCIFAGKVRTVKARTWYEAREKACLLPAFRKVDRGMLDIHLSPGVA